MIIVGYYPLQLRYILEFIAEYSEEEGNILGEME